MPKTIEEYEALVAERDGQLKTLKDKLDTVTEQLTHAQTVITEKDSKIGEYEKAQRAEIELELHGLDKDFDCNEKSNDVLISYIAGMKKMKAELEEHAVTQTDPSVPDAKGKSSPEKPKVNEVDAFLNS